MTTITVSDDTRVKVVRRKDEVLTSQDKVIRDLLERAETVPVTALKGQCQQCEEYKSSLEKSNDVGLEIQSKYNDLRVEYKALEDELAAAKADIEALESVSDVVVLDEDSEILG